MAVTIDGTNGITSPDFEPSSSTTPTNGLFLPTTNSLAWATNSTERLRLDASGNLGLGVTPSAWGSNFRALQIGPAASFATYNGTGSDVRIYCNAFLNSSSNPTYIQSSLGAGAFQVANNEFRWYTAPSGTAGNAISFTQAMTLDASGNLGIGTTSPGYRLDARGGNAAFVNTSGLNVYFGYGLGTSQYGYINVPSDGSGFKIGADTSLPLVFQTNGSERARIDSSGNLLVGATSPLLTGTHSFVNTSATACSLTVRNTNASAGGYWRLGPDSTNNFVVYNQNSVGMYMATGATSWTANVSDERLKNKVFDLQDALQAIKKLKPLTFFYKNEPNVGVPRYGFFAQNVGESIPDAMLVSPEKDPDLGEIYTYDPAIINVYLVKAIQELTARLEALEAK